MKFVWYFAVIAAVLALVHNVRADEEPAAVASVVEIPAESPTLIEVDAGVKGEGELNRETRQFRTFGFGRPRPYFGGGGGGFYRPRPRPPFYGGGGGFYGGGGGFYRPRPPFYGGGYYRPPPPPFYGGYYRPPPFYGGFFG